MPESHLYGERAAGVHAPGADAAVANIVGALSDHRRRMARLLVAQLHGGSSADPFPKKETTTWP